MVAGSTSETEIIESHRFAVPPIGSRRFALFFTKAGLIHRKEWIDIFTSAFASVVGKP
jgi:hypothetical protein